MNKFLSDVQKHKKIIYAMLHILILILSVYLVLCISIDTFKNLTFYREPRFQHVQFWICIVFLADFFGELYLSDNKKEYLLTHSIFFLVSIPYQAIINHYGWVFDKQITYILSFIPLVRGGYAMAIVVGWFASNRAAGLFVTYLFTLLSTVYFASLAFYLFEHPINSLVNNYTDALWWAFMDVTTVGSNIVAVSTIGKVLSVLLAALGMMMFPIFTVYMSSILRTHNQSVANKAVIEATTHPTPDDHNASSASSNNS